MGVWPPATEISKAQNSIIQFDSSYTFRIKKKFVLTSQANLQSPQVLFIIFIEKMLNLF